MIRRDASTSRVRTMANAQVTDVWMGSAADKSKKLAGPIPKDSLKKIFYSVKGMLAGDETIKKLVVGIMVDGQLIENTRIDITKKNAGQENPFWFSYPDAKKNPGEHTVQFGIGTTDDLDARAQTVKQWSMGMSNPYKFSIQ
jgi:hypothetical protein